MFGSAIKHILDKGFPNLSYKIAPPDVKTHGHLSTNIAFAISQSKGQKKMSPMHAAEIVKEFVSHTAPKHLFGKIEVVQPGFVNFWFTKEAIQNEFGKISKDKNFGKPHPTLLKLRRARKVIVEYSSPNIAKPMHVGHFRGTIIGDCIANIHKFLGFRTIRWNYLGDWGTQFGKLVAAYKLWGGEKALQEAPIKHLLDLYVRFAAEVKTNPKIERRGREEFEKLEKGDAENRKLWEKFKEESTKEFRKTYKLLNVNFDISIGESFYEKDLKPIIEYLISEEIAVESEGAIIIPLDDFKLPPALIRKSDEVSLYLTRDIANLIYRVKKYKPVKILYEIGSEQELHFKQLFAIAKADFLPSLKEAKKTELVHVAHGLILGEDGKKLSTRAGKTIFFEDVIEEAIQKTKKIIEEKNPSLAPEEKQRVAKTVAVGALKYNDLSQNRLSNITFDWDKMLSFEGDSGPYLQYSYARLKSILRKAKSVKTLDTKHLDNVLELEIILKLDRFPEVIEKVGENYYPSELANYLYDLAQSTNHFYHTLPVLKAESGTRSARLALIQCVAKVLRTGLNLLGIETLEKM